MLLAMKIVVCSATQVEGGRSCTTICTANIGRRRIP
jgi:hypothetical protein